MNHSLWTLPRVSGNLPREELGWGGGAGGGGGGGGDIFCGGGTKSASRMYPPGQPGQNVLADFIQVDIIHKRINSIRRAMSYI